MDQVISGQIVAAVGTHGIVYPTRQTDLCQALSERTLSALLLPICLKCFLLFQKCADVFRNNCPQRAWELVGVIKFGVRGERAQSLCLYCFRSCRPLVRLYVILFSGVAQMVGEYRLS